MKASSEVDTSKIRVVALISGGGTNLQAIIDHASAGDLPIQVVAVISNRPGVKGLQRAELAGVPAYVIDHKAFDDRDQYDIQLMELIDSLTPDLIVLAGFMRILTPAFSEYFEGRVMNIHPSLLPKYPGLHTHQRALDAGDSEHGVTVHFVTAELDGGPIIVQAKVPILAQDTAAALAQRVLAQEHKVYPLAIKWFAEGRLCMNKSACFLDNELLPSTGYLYS